MREEADVLLIFKIPAPPTTILVEAVSFVVDNCAVVVNTDQVFTIVIPAEAVGLSVPVKITLNGRLFASPDQEYVPLHHQRVTEELTNVSCDGQTSLKHRVPVNVVVPLLARVRRYTTVSHDICGIDDNNVFVTTRSGRPRIVPTVVPLSTTEPLRLVNTKSALLV